MRALRLLEPGVLRLAEVPVPGIGPDEVLVKVAGAGLCHSDLHLTSIPDLGGASWTLGHETAGTVAATGDAVEGFAEGDPVLVSLVWACGRCRACAGGHDNRCEANGRRGTPSCPGLGPDGGMAEYMKVNARYLEPLGDLDPVTAGPLADAGLTPMHVVNSARTALSPGATALVIGVGGLGHVGLQILKATTSVRVIAVDSSREKCDLARRLGADEVLPAGEDTAGAVLDLTGNQGADAVFDFVGIQSTVDLAAGAVAPGGALRFAGLGGGLLPYRLDGRTDDLPWGVDIRTSYAGTRAEQREVISLASQGLISLHIRTYALDDGLRAFADLGNGRVPGRAVLVP